MTAHDESLGPEGYQVDAVEAWIDANVEGLKTPLKWTRLEGGHSNLTYQLEDANGRLAVIRRPPQGELLPKAHDMSREWALISALGPTDVPVPEALGFCESPDVTGAWFYVMGHINGKPLYNSDDTNAIVPQSERRKMAFNFIDVLAALHSVDPDEVGLGELGKRDSYVGRQLKTWYRSWTSSIEDAEFDDPRAHDLQEFFLNNLPDQGPIRIVHGDYAPHNILIGPDCLIHAVVDWEISTLGDPLADLAYALNPWPDPTDPEPPLPEAALAPPGFPTRTELAARYGEVSGRDLSNLDYYIAFNRWKSAAIIHGVYGRYRAGKKSTEGIDMEEMRERIGRSLDLAELAANRLSYS